MATIFLQTSGCAFFFFCTIILGLLLRKYPSKKVRITTTMIIHFIGVVCFMLPVLIGIFNPELLTSYDKIIGLPSLPYRPLTLTSGLVLFSIGLFFVFASLFYLMAYGNGMAGFYLTENVVKKSVYKVTRNPMSFGFYLVCLAAGLLSSSTYFTLLILIEVIPSHIFYLKFFEELELELRFGPQYLEYKKRVSFLIPIIYNVNSCVADKSK